MIKIVILIIASILSGILYRLGGIGKPWNTKWRDLGCPTIFILTLLFLGKIGCSVKFLLSYFLTFGLMFGAMTTYFDSIFNYDNYYAHGLAIGLACLPLTLIGLHWLSILLRAIVCAVGMGMWSNLIDEDWLEEFGRGFITCATIPLLLL